MDASFKSKDVFAIRQLIKQLPKLKNHLFNGHLNHLISSLYKSKFFLSKAIYFDKPSASNWFVPYHQDLSISIDKKLEIENFTNWTHKKGYYGVQPPLYILEDTITLRIHLDNTTLNNGALKVIPKSHKFGIILKDSQHWNLDKEQICEVKKGGAMLMKPLLLHASSKTTNKRRRRVIHLEFNKHQLPKPLQWFEYLETN